MEFDNIFNSKMDDFDTIIEDNKIFAIKLIKINFPKFENKKFVKEIYEKLEYYKKNGNIHKKKKSFKIQVLFASIHKNIIELCSLFLFVQKYYDNYENIENVKELFSYFVMIVKKSRSICNIIDIHNEKLNEYNCDYFNNFVKFGKKYYHNIHKLLSKIKSEHVYTSHLHKVLLDESIELFASYDVVIF